MDRLFAGAHPLIPSDSEVALGVRRWDRFFDNYLQGPMQQIVADRMRGAKADMSKERSTLETAYHMVEPQIMSKIWIAGKEFSMADCAAAPAPSYASTSQPFPDEFSHLRAYFDRLAERPSVQRVIDEGEPYLSLYPLRMPFRSVLFTGDE